MIKDEEYRLELLDDYVFWYGVYHMPFKNRLFFNLGFHHISFGPNEEDKKLSTEELEYRIDHLKKPWWNFLFHFGI